jgi:hypothetical protein
VRLSLRIDPEMCLCVTLDGSKMRNSSTKSNCHHRRNRRPVGSSVGTSGEGVWALSCSLLENFAPSDEPTPSRLLTIGSSGAEDICLSSQTRAQLLRRVIKIGRRTIQCLVSHWRSVAPMVRPTLLFFRPSVHPTLYKSVGPTRHNGSAPSLSSNPNPTLPRTRSPPFLPERCPARLRPPSACACALRQPSAAPRVRHRPPHLATALNRALPPPQP